MHGHHIFVRILGVELVELFLRDLPCSLFRIRPGGELENFVADSIRPVEVSEQLREFFQRHAVDSEGVGRSHLVHEDTNLLEGEGGILDYHLQVVWGAVGFG